MSELRRILRALGYSREGLASAFRNEAAFRSECWLAALLLPVALALPLPLLFRAYLVFAVLLVLITELLNSAIEATVDRISSEIHPLAKRAKDMGSAAVFLALVNALLVWLLALWSMLGHAAG